MPLSAARTPRWARALRAVCLLVLAAVLVACQVSVATDVTVEADGSGRIAVHVELDEEITASLAADDVDVLAGLEELPDGWTSERSDRDGRTAVTLAADFADPAGLAERVEQLQSGLDAEDPLLLDRLDLAVDDDGGARLEGRAGLRPPSSTGLRGAGVAFDGDDLADLLAERGDEVLRVELRVTMPGPIARGNADEVDGRTATWRLPVTELAAVEAVSHPPSALRQWLVVGAAALIGLVVGLFGVRLVSRRRLLLRR